MLGARPDVFSHNIETVRRLHRRMRGAKASYDGALWLLRRAKELAEYPVLTKTGIIAGLGESNEEVVETLRELRAHGVDVVTIGQYLQPSAKHVPIDRWVHPDEFAWFREQGEALGFGSVFAGPLVRSSYRADERGTLPHGPRRRRVLSACPRPARGAHLVPLARHGDVRAPPPTTPSLPSPPPPSCPRRRHEWRPENAEGRPQAAPRANPGRTLIRPAVTVSVFTTFVCPASHRTSSWPPPCMSRFRLARGVLANDFPRPAVSC